MTKPSAEKIRLAQFLASYLLGDGGSDTAYDSYSKALLRLPVSLLSDLHRRLAQAPCTNTLNMTSSLDPI